LYKKITVNHNYYSIHSALLAKILLQ